MAEFAYFTGPMDCGKSTLALQLDYTHSAGGRRGRLFTSQDRAGTATISSRLGLARPAVEVVPQARHLVQEHAHGFGIHLVVAAAAP